MKKILVALFVAVAAASVQASYLYWQVLDEVTAANTGKTYSHGTDYTVGSIYAVVTGSTTGNALALVDPQSGTSLGVTMAGDTQRWAVDLSGLGAESDLSSYSFYVEYMKYNSESGEYEQVAIGEAETYDTLKNDYVGSELSTSIAATWHGGTINAPEPTSALLMLLGVAGLALKRKQRKAE